MNDQMLAVRIRGGLDICVPDDIALLTTYVLIEQEDWFEDEIRFVRKLLRSGDFVIDIGANYGVYAITAAAAVGRQGRVCAFEPASRTASFLRQSVKRNQLENVEVLTSALSDTRGNASLAISPNSELNALVDVRDPAGAYEEIHTDTMDDCMARWGWSNIAFVKLDAEGHEERILQGAQRFLATNSPLVMYEIRAGERINMDLVGAFQALEYQSYRLMPGLGVLVPFDAASKVDRYQLNLFACKRDRAEALAGNGLLASRFESVAAPAGGFLRGRWLECQGLRDEYCKFWPDSWRRMCATPSGASYAEALDCYVAAHDAALPVTQRAGFLMRALELLETVVRSPDSNLGRMLSFARVAAEAGYRGMAVSAYQRMLAGIRQGVTFDGREPFLPPPFSAQLDARDLRKAVIAGILEHFERLASHSSYFAGNSHQGLLEEFAALGFPSPEMERRRQLVRLRYGLAVAPELRSLLVTASERNLNPDFWIRHTAQAG
jgi:FkbM family methyltransferase